MNKFMRFLTKGVLICIFFYSAYNIYIKLDDYKQADEVYTELREMNVSSEIDTDTDSDKKDLAVKKEDLTSINEDFQFWIEIENTNVDYPVVQYSDNDFYLNLDFNKNPSSSGSIFMDYRNDFNTDKNIILYGHNMKNKSMFQNVILYKEKDFFEQNNKIKIYANDKLYVYEVFCAYAVDANFDYLHTDFDSDEDFMSYINKVTSKSYYPYTNKVLPSDKIITLSTCSYETNNSRTVVHGKLCDTFEYAK